MPSAGTDPYLSFVIAARNDDYAGGMLRRLQVCIDTFLHQAETFELPSELILVDWNSPPDEGLASAVRWPRSTRWCSVRVITVPPAVHATQRFSDRLPILIHRARNVGIRRARGQFVLPTSADILCSDELIDMIAASHLEACALYRIARHDVPLAALDIADYDARLQFCRDHVQVVHERRGSYCVAGAPALFTNAAGDFTLLSRELYCRLRGVPEEREYHSMHWDSIFCFMAYAACGKEIIFTDPCRIYHVDHGTPSWRARPRLVERVAARLPIGTRRAKRLAKRVRAQWPPRSSMDERGVPYLNLKKPADRAEFESRVRRIVGARGSFVYNDADWGLGDHDLPEQSIS
jgi:hypothetical protein